MTLALHCSLRKIRKRWDPSACLAEKGKEVTDGSFNVQDPKEYLPFLKNLKQLDTCIQRHQIDDHLRRYAKALANLVAAGPAHFEEVKSYVQIHGLYSEALALYTEDLPKLRSIHQIHGDYLYSRNKYDQAALSTFVRAPLKKHAS